MSAASFEPENVTWEGTTDLLQSASTNDVLTAGRVVYRQQNGQVAPASPASEDSAAVDGITVGSANSDQFVSIADDGVLNLQSITLVQGGVYCAGPAGTIVPHSDLPSGSWVTIVGVAISTSQLLIRIVQSGARVA